MPQEWNIEDRFFDIYGRIAQTRDEVYTLWAMLEKVKRDVQALKALPGKKKSSKGKRSGRRTGKRSRK
jgi:hypothetical protein